MPGVEARRAAVRWRAYCVPLAVAAALALGVALPDFPDAGGGAPPGMAVVEDELLLDINSATAEQLAGLPGMGNALAEAIVEYRQAVGGFDGTWQLVEVKGFGPGRLETLAGKICALPYGG